MGLALKDHHYHCYGDYLTWPEDVRCELIDGDVYLIAPAPVLAHQEAEIVNVVVASTVKSHSGLYS